MGANVTVKRNFRLDTIALVTREDLRAVGEHALLLIRARTARGIDADGQPFAPYAPSYAEHKGAYVFSGVASSTRPDLTLTGEMLNNMQIVDLDPATSTVTLGWVR